MYDEFDETQARNAFIKCAYRTLAVVQFALNVTYLLSYVTLFVWFVRLISRD